MGAARRDFADANNDDHEDGYGRTHSLSSYISGLGEEQYLGDGFFVDRLPGSAMHAEDAETDQSGPGARMSASGYLTIGAGTRFNRRAQNESVIDDFEEEPNRPGDYDVFVDYIVKEDNRDNNNDDIYSYNNRPPKSASDNNNNNNNNNNINDNNNCNNNNNMIDDIYCYNNRPRKSTGDDSGGLRSDEAASLKTRPQPVYSPISELPATALRVLAYETEPTLYQTDDDNNESQTDSADVDKQLNSRAPSVNRQRSASSHVANSSSSSSSNNKSFTKRKPIAQAYETEESFLPQSHSAALAVLTDDNVIEVLRSRAPAVYSAVDEQAAYASEINYRGSLRPASEATASTASTATAAAAAAAAITAAARMKPAVVNRYETDESYRLSLIENQNSESHAATATDANADAHADANVELLRMRAPAVYTPVMERKTSGFTRKSTASQNKNINNDGNSGNRAAPQFRNPPQFNSSETELELQPASSSAQVHVINEPHPGNLSARPPAVYDPLEELLVASPTNSRTGSNAAQKPVVNRYEVPVELARGNNKPGMQETSFWWNPETYETGDDHDAAPTTNRGASVAGRSSSSNITNNNTNNNNNNNNNNNIKNNKGNRGSSKSVKNQNTENFDENINGTVGQPRYEVVD